MRRPKGEFKLWWLIEPGDWREDQRLIIVGPVRYAAGCKQYKNSNAFRTHKAAKAEKNRRDALIMGA